MPYFVVLFGQQFKSDLHIVIIHFDHGHLASLNRFHAIFCSYETNRSLIDISTLCLSSIYDIIDTFSKLIGIQVERELVSTAKFKMVATTSTSVIVAVCKPNL